MTRDVGPELERACDIVHMIPLCPRVPSARLSAGAPPGLPPGLCGHRSN